MIAIYNDSATLDFILKLSTIAAILIGAYCLFQSSWTHTRQMNGDIFLKYTERFEKVMSSFPANAWQARLHLDGAAPDASPELTVAVLKYMNLCGEEFHLWRSGYLQNSIWTIWRDEMCRTFRTPLFRREWPSLRAEFDSFPEFLTFVEKALVAPTPPGP